MALLPAVRNLLTMQPAPIPQRAERAFVTGPATVEPSQVYWGVDNQAYQPPEYVNYPAISNGVYACVNVRSKTLASLPLRVYRLAANGDRSEITSGPLWLLLRKVNPYWTMPRLLEMTEQSLCVWGEAFWFLERSGQQPAEIWWARADRVTVHPHPTEYISHFSYEGPGGREIRFERDETVWFRYANVADQYSGLSPLAAARLAADTASAAMHSNANIFRNGVQMSGVLMPKTGTSLTPEQAEEVANALDRRFRGVDKAHRLGVLRYEIDVKTLSMTPKDAEFLGAMNWSLEDIARAYSVPIDKIGGKRTYQNVEESEKVFWHDCMLPEAQFVAAEITEQLLPHFGVDLIAEFDTSDVAVLHEAETERWTRRKEMIATGYETINALRAEDGLPPVPWGDVWWAQSTLIPIDSNEKPEPVMPAFGPGPQPEADPGADPEEAEDDEPPPPRSRMVAYGSDEHQRLWDRFVQQSEPYERSVAAATRSLLLDQRQSVLAQLRQRGKRDIADILFDPFDRPRWIKRFTMTIKPVFGEIVRDAGSRALDELALGLSFDVQEPRVIDFLQARSQRFAVEVNDTTWRMLKEALAEGVELGEDVDALAQRVTDVMADRIRSSATTIARTEAIGAMNGGTLLSWRQSGVVAGKEWLAALDERTRESHLAAHGQTVGIDDDFSVGAGRGPAPGQIGVASEDINCRCTLLAVLDVQAEGAL